MADPEMADRNLNSCPAAVRCMGVEVEAGAVSVHPAKHELPGARCTFPR